MLDDIYIVGAKEHNLKNIDVHIARNKLVVITGLSGSGKSSLAMDTLYAEGQRRYVESLSSYARQFLGLMEKPHVDSIQGLSPAIAIDQKTTSKNPRSTVGTITEIYDYLRLLYAKIGRPHCPHCHIPIAKQSLTKIADRILKTYADQKIMVMAPLIKAMKGEHKEILADLRKEGYVRARIDGAVVLLENEIHLARYKAHDIDVVIDRISVREGIRSRLVDSLETAAAMGQGLISIYCAGQNTLFSEKFSCITCGFSYAEISARLFSFNSPYGACPSCDGLGTKADPDNNEFHMMYRYKRTLSQTVKENIEEAMSKTTCPACNGTRLKKESLSVTVNGMNIADVCALNITRLSHFFETFLLKKNDELIARPILKEIHARIQFLQNVGLYYLSLDRSAGTLSGGEAQRIRLATQIGSGLVNVLYILDEPSIGLHQRDNDRLLSTLEKLRDTGNTLIVIEHDADTMQRADQIIDMGPGAGIHGGQVMFSGSYADIKQSDTSLTGRYLSGKEHIPIPAHRRSDTGQSLTLKGICHNNLKNITVRFPLHQMICVTGVSGSGKSSLVNDVLYKALMQKMYGSKEKPGAHTELKGLDAVDKVIIIDQAPIGRTPRSNPATYTGIFTPIRELFAMTPDAKLHGYTPARFSFNVKGGRCESCEGAGNIKVEMNFMPDVYVACDECKGKRYNKDTLRIRYKNKTIADILAMTVEEAGHFFDAIPKIKNKLDTLLRVGLSYISLGQSALTLSGGEAQRIKLSRELAKRTQGHTLYILDEPTTGLHFADISKLLDVLNRLVNKGNTVLIIEHNLDIIKNADHIIDLGPEGGDGGGRVIATGTPEALSQHPDSYTGYYLKHILY